MAAPRTPARTRNKPELCGPRQGCCAGQPRGKVSGASKFTVRDADLLSRTITVDRGVSKATIRNGEEIRKPRFAYSGRWTGSSCPRCLSAGLCVRDATHGREAPLSRNHGRARPSRLFPVDLPVTFRFCGRPKVLSVIGQDRTPRAPTQPARRHPRSSSALPPDAQTSVKPQAAPAEPAAWGRSRTAARVTGMQNDSRDSYLSCPESPDLGDLRDSGGPGRLPPGSDAKPKG